MDYNLGDEVRVHVEEAGLKQTSHPEDAEH